MVALGLPPRPAGWRVRHARLPALTRHGWAACEPPPRRAPGLLPALSAHVILPRQPHRAPHQRGHQGPARCGPGARDQPGHHPHDLHEPPGHPVRGGCLHLVDHHPHRAPRGLLPEDPQHIPEVAHRDQAVGCGDAVASVRALCAVPRWPVHDSRLRRFGPRARPHGRTRGRQRAVGLGGAGLRALALHAPRLGWRHGDPRMCPGRGGAPGHSGRCVHRPHAELCSLALLLAHHGDAPHVPDGEQLQRRGASPPLRQHAPRGRWPHCGHRAAPAVADGRPGGVRARERSLPP
mmetsp:Transcript_22693/g.61461  ORF Transcript_22693/g.61461 Transcript_22693/m.61461 type:complete len:292 (+) Transcript_22693:1084-1959(+)